MAQTILRLPEVKARTGLSRSTIYLKMAEGSFPEPNFREALEASAGAFHSMVFARAGLPGIGNASVAPHGPRIRGLGMSPPSRLTLAIAAILLTACADTPADTSGLRIVRRTPDEFCRSTARSVAIDRYNMKKDGMPLRKALDGNGGVAVIDAITNAVYSRDLRSESQAADEGTAACLAYFR